MFATIAVLVISTPAGITHLTVSDVQECVQIQQTLQAVVSSKVRMDCIEVQKSKKAKKS